MSGGVEQDPTDVVHDVAASYSLHLTFTDQDETYVSDVDIRIRSADGAISLVVTSEGPLLYAHLPRDQYQINAFYNDVIRQGMLTVPAHGAIVHTVTWLR